MSRLVESIQVYKGSFCRISLHEERMNSSRKILFGETAPIKLTPVLAEEFLIWSAGMDQLPDKVKCRVIYGHNIESISFEPYFPRIIKSLQLVENDEIDYSHKWLERPAIQSLFSMRGECDDILIIKDGLVTDTSISNVAYFDGNNWLTPNRPLLAGTCRRWLLENNIIKESNIKASDISQYLKVRLFNAMIDWKDEMDVDVQKIRE